MQKEFSLVRASSLIVLGLLLTITIFAYIRWAEVVKPGGRELSAEREKEIDARINRLQNAELYVLKAEVSGYFLCPLCPPEVGKNGKYFLNTGEIYKYGVTTNPNERYSKSELARYRLNYILLDIGGIGEMMIKETTLIGLYAILPENLAREKKYRLAIPPGSGADLR